MKESKVCQFCGISSGNVERKKIDGYRVNICNRCQKMRDNRIEDTAKGKFYSDRGIGYEFKIRNCLKCDREFTSRNDYRLCFRCKRSNFENYGYDDTTYNVDLEEK